MAMEQPAAGPVAYFTEELPCVPLEASWSSYSGFPSLSGALGDVARRWPRSCMSIMSILPLQALGWQRTKLRPTFHHSKHRSRLTTIHNLLPLLHRPTPKARELPKISLWNIAVTVALLRPPLFARSVALKFDTANWYSWLSRVIERWFKISAYNPSIIYQLEACSFSPSYMTLLCLEESGGWVNCLYTSTIQTWPRAPSGLTFLWTVFSFHLFCSEPAITASEHPFVNTTYLVNPPDVERCLYSLLDNSSLEPSESGNLCTYYLPLTPTSSWRAWLLLSLLWTMFLICCHFQLILSFSIMTMSLF